MEVVNSCEDCKSKCCASGPGPYKPLRFEDWYETSISSEGYNTKCENFLTTSGRCMVWGTAQLPIACLLYVCGNKKLSKKKLQIMTDVRKEFQV